MGIYGDEWSKIMGIYGDIVEINGNIMGLYGDSWEMNGNIW